MDYTVKQWQRIIKDQKLTFFLALENDKGEHKYLPVENATEPEAVQFAEDAFKYTGYLAVYLFDAYCPECQTIGTHIVCDHELEPATHLDPIYDRRRMTLGEFAPATHTDARLSSLRKLK